MKKLLFILIFISAVISTGATTVPVKNKTFRISKNITIFNDVLRELDMYYVDTLNYDKMMKSTIDNMLEKLDPYTVYIPEEETDDLAFMTSGEYAGIGAVISKQGKEIVVTEPYEGMPAQRNDVRAGDVIIEIDGKKTEGISVSDASALLKGTPNTIIQLKLKRYGDKKNIEKSFKREKIQMNPVSYYSKVADKTGYVLLTDFTDKAASEMKLAINDMIKKYQIESLVIDVRNNGGGLVDEAVKILGFFVPKGTEIVNTKGKTPDVERIYKTTTEPAFANLKLAVLANRGSASAAEILAGSIQDLDRGIIVGERTFGKGLVQNIRPIDFGGNLKVTTAKYYIPSGRCIQAIDYSHRNEDGSVGRVPDSLTHVFYTKNGRKVRDGGGINPDSVITDNQKLNISYYIYTQNFYFDYATKFVATHPTIAPASSFHLTDSVFADFVKYLKERKFTYVSQSEKYFNELVDVAKYEGFDKTAAAEFDALKARLTPDIDKNIADNKQDIIDLLSVEIVKRYYFQKGEVEYSLRNDKDLEAALSLLSLAGRYETALARK